MLNAYRYDWLVDTLKYMPIEKQRLTPSERQYVNIMRKHMAICLIVIFIFIGLYCTEIALEIQCKLSLS